MESDEIVLREMCLVNGINYEKLCQSAGNFSVKKLEIFFFGCSHIPKGLQKFSSLSILCIVNQQFEQISNLESCPMLEELWICETQVKKIEGLLHCSRLVRLYLYDNLIAKIEGLERLAMLEKLWLNGNCLAKIEGLEELHLLRDLNLSCNQLSDIGTSLNHLSHLEILNLSGNKISSLNEIVHLSDIHSLRSLSFCHPMDSPNPVCYLCNYSTHTLYHLPHLCWLDGREIGFPELQKFVQGLVLRKIQFYHMKIHHWLAASSHKKQQLQKKLDLHLDTCYRKLRIASKTIKSLEYSSASSEKICLLSSQASIINKEMRRAREIVSSLCRSIETETEKKCQFHLIELESGGNIRLSHCDPTQSAFKACSDVVNSRFSIAEVHTSEITGLEVTHVTRVENRLLFNRFNDKLKDLMDQEPYSSMTTNQIYKRMINYFFLVWKPENSSLQEIARDGFSSTQPFLWLTNSVSRADHIRLTREQNFGGQHGQLLLCKLFTGQSIDMSATSDLPVINDFANVDSISRTHELLAEESATEFCSKDWFIRDQDFVLPEYIIDFKYISTSHRNASLELTFSNDSSLPCDAEISDVDAGPHLVMLDEKTLLTLTGQDSLAAIQHLNVFNHHLTRFRLASNLVQLTSLIISANELTTAEDFTNLPNLELLDISFNKIVNLRGLKNIPKLKSLNVSWNCLTNYRQELSPLHKHCPLLEVLDTRYNHWLHQEQLRTYVLGRLKTLHTLDGSSASPEETTAALKHFTSSQLCLGSLLEHARSVTVPPPSLSVEPIAHRLMRHIPSARPLSSSTSSEWSDKVTTLCLCHLHLHKVAFLSQFPNLKWLSLADNALTSIKDIPHFLKIEELNLDANLLTDIEGIEDLDSLQWLSLVCNQLSSLSVGFQRLKKLQHLNLSQNNLSDIQELQVLVCVSELYLSGNQMQNLRHLFALKALGSLAVLDLSFNPLTVVNNYRVFVVFHFPNLMALDGMPIDVFEVVEAKERLGGWLTQDYIFQKFPGIVFSEMKKFDLPNSGLKHVDLSPVDSFNTLVSLNLENNSLTCFSGLAYLSNLKVLCLNHNRVESFLQEETNCSSYKVHDLQVLHLAYNGITSITQLQLGHFPSLRALFLQGNEITQVEGLAVLSNLVELVLDRNKIKALQEHSLARLSSLKELHLEENRLKSLSYVSICSLQRLYLGMNRIQDFGELEKLRPLQQIIELSLFNNPVSRRLHHRLMLVYQHPSILSLDGILVTTEEKQAAECTFSVDEREIDLPTEHIAPIVVLPQGYTSYAGSASAMKIHHVPFVHADQTAKRRTDSTARVNHGLTQTTPNIIR